MAAYATGPTSLFATSVLIAPSIQGLDGPVIGAVLLAAAAHAVWNAWIKSSADKALDTALTHSFAGLWALLPALWVGLPPPEVRHLWLMTSVLHLSYYLALSKAYQHGDLGLAYPVMRGTAPLLVTAVSAAVIGEVPSAAGWIGALGITAGVLMVGLGRPGALLTHRHALGYALLTAVIIAAYTLVDGQGTRGSGPELRGVLSYVLWVFVGNALPFTLLLAWRRGPSGRQHMLSALRERAPRFAIGGLASLGSYAVALWAMSRAPIASVAALRETSVLFAAFMAHHWLGEPWSHRRMAGAVLVVAGVMALRLG